jgi:hypothetical protein
MDITKRVLSGIDQLHQNLMDAKASVSKVPHTDIDHDPPPPPPPLPPPPLPSIPSLLALFLVGHSLQLDSGAPKKGLTTRPSDAFEPSTSGGNKEDAEAEICRVLGLALTLLAQKKSDERIQGLQLGDALAGGASIGDLLNDVVAAYEQSTFFVQRSSGGEGSGVPDGEGSEGESGTPVSPAGSYDDIAEFDSGGDSENPMQIISSTAPVLTEQLSVTPPSGRRSEEGFEMDHGLDAEEVQLSLSQLTLNDEKANNTDPDADVDEWENDDDSGFVSIRMTKQEFLEVERQRLSELENDLDIENESTGSNPEGKAISAAVLNATEEQCGGSDYTAG